jgi:hypothetical protein
VSSQSNIIILGGCLASSLYPMARFQSERIMRQIQIDLPVAELGPQSEFLLQRTRVCVGPRLSAAKSPPIQMEGTGAGVNLASREISGCNEITVI